MVSKKHTDGRGMPPNPCFVISATYKPEGAAHDGEKKYLVIRPSLNDQNVPGAYAWAKRRTFATKFPTRGSAESYARALREGGHPLLEGFKVEVYP